MALFRVIVQLDKGGTILQPGSFTRLEWLSSRKQEVLQGVGAVSEVGSPPLVVIPGWKTRAGKLEEVGIEDLVQFIEADTAVLCQALDRQPVTIEKYRAELLRWMTADEPLGG